MLLPARLRSALGVSWNVGRGRSCPPQLQTGSFTRYTPVGAAHARRDLLSAFVGAFLGGYSATPCNVDVLSPDNCPLPGKGSPWRRNIIKKGEVSSALVGPILFLSTPLNFVSPEPTKFPSAGPSSSGCRENRLLRERGLTLCQL